MQWTFSVSTSEQANAISAVLTERQYQEAIWGKDTPEDPGHKTKEEWAHSIFCYAHNTGYALDRKPDRTFKERMVKAAALAVAALEWAEKNNIN